MLLAVLISNSVGNILVERFSGVPAEERLHWRSFLTKLGSDNLRRARNEELFVASNKSVYVVYTMFGDVHLYVVGKDEYDELALAEVIFVLTGIIRDACKKPPSERLFLDNYGKICLSLDEIVWKPLYQNLLVLSLCLVLVAAISSYLGCFFLCFDVKGILENTDKDRIKRLIRLKPPTPI